MALQSSGTIKISEIAGEFGGTTPHSLSEYYGSDTGVPTGDPGDETISISDFYGTSASNTVSSLNIYMVGGGGGGGVPGTTAYGGYGGGGGGEYKATTNQSVSAGSYSIVIGTGGSAGSAGGSTLFKQGASTLITALGGGRGAGLSNAATVGGGDGSTRNGSTTTGATRSWDSFTGGDGHDEGDEGHSGGGGAGAGGHGEDAYASPFFGEQGADSPNGGDGGSGTSMPLGNGTRTVGAGGGGGRYGGLQNSARIGLGGRANTSYGSGADGEALSSTAITDALAGQDGYGEGGGGGCSTYNSSGYQGSAAAGGDGFVTISHDSSKDQLTLSPAADSTFIDSGLRWYHISQNTTITIS